MHGMTSRQRCGLGRGAQSELTEGINALTCLFSILRNSCKCFPLVKPNWKARESVGADHVGHPFRAEVKGKELGGKVKPEYLVS